MRVLGSLKYLITCYHTINENDINKMISIEIWNKKRLNMTLNRFIKFFKLPLDITAIEIKKTDDIYKDIEFLDYDPNYQKGYF